MTLPHTWEVMLTQPSCNQVLFTKEKLAQYLDYFLFKIQLLIDCCFALGVVLTPPQLLLPLVDSPVDWRSRHFPPSFYIWFDGGVLAFSWLDSPLLAGKLALVSLVEVGCLPDKNVCTRGFCSLLLARLDLCLSSTSVRLFDQESLYIKGFDTSQGETF